VRRITSSIDDKFDRLAERSDPVDDLIGLSDVEPVDDVDAVVYGNGDSSMRPASP
jgi:hypothetical protein